MSDQRGQRLGETGQILLSQAAVRAYCEWSGLREEEGRRELTALLVDAKRVGTTDSGAERWRYRSRSTGTDCEAHITRNGPIAVVVHVRVRGTPRAHRHDRSPYQS